MNREIKFRGINTETGEWVYGTYLDGFIINGVAEATEEYICIEDWRLVREETVGQYTGFKDKTGKEIFEGDVLEVYDRYGKDMLYTAVVYWNDGYWDAKQIGRNNFKCCYAGFSKCEIIGNIYDNPELLEV